MLVRVTNRCQTSREGHGGWDKGRDVAELVGDQDLLKRVATGDQAAMRVLYERHHDAVYAFIRGRCGDEATAADVVHNAMLEVWRGAARFAGAASVKSWIFTIARNKLVDRYRQGGRLHLVDEVPETADEAPDPEAVAMAARDAGRVRACLDKLKDAHRAVIRLAFFDDLSYDEIGAIERVPVGTVKTRIFHAKQLLMRCLGQR